MPTDLFRDNLSALTEAELYSAIEAFAKAQPSEGWRHDYTEQWTDTALKNIAAFSNTFGGILIVGVRKGKTDLACELLGIESEGEYKTRIASSIAANISPTPFYDVFECHKPSHPSLKFCVVRVREGKSLHLITKKGISPVYIRNEDEALVADASQLRRLIDREGDMPSLAARVEARATQLRDTMAINCGYQNQDSERWYMSPRRPSPTSLKLEMIRIDTLALELDESHEERVSKLVSEFYPRIVENVREGVAMQTDMRHADFYEYTAYHKNLDFETRWRVTAEGDLGHATQISYQVKENQNAWSIVDLARSLILFHAMALKWWESIGYFGEGYLHAHLMVDGLSVLREPTHGYYVYAFDPTYAQGRRRGRLDIRKDAVLLSPSPGNAANAETKVIYSFEERDLTRTTVSVMNQLLRSLNHVVRRSILQSSIDSLIDGLIH